MTDTIPAKKRLSKAERDLQIKNCALEIFAAHGFSGASTRQIAEKAGISETLIFQLFKSKEELYKESFKSLLYGNLFDDLQKHADDKNDHAVFHTSAMKIFKSVEEKPIIIRLIFFAALDNFSPKDKKEGFGQRLIHFLSDYISRRVADGAFRDVNPVLSAQMFIHSVFLSAADKVMDVGLDGQNYSAEEGVDNIVDLFLEGIRTCQGRRQVISRMIIPF